MRYGLRVLPEGVEAPSAEEVMRATRDAGFGDEVKRRIILGTYALSSGYYDAYYGQAQKVRTLISRDFAAAFEQADVLVSPTAPTTAFKLGEKLDDPLAMYLNDLATIPANLAGVPGISRAVRARRRGRPARPACRCSPRRWPTTGSTGSAPRSRRCCTDQWGGPLLAQAPDARRSLRMTTTSPDPVLSFDEALEQFDPVMGLEVHVELNTASKMFCGCATEFGAEPNTQVCPVCLGLPGALPVVNATAVESAIRIGLALNCEIAEWCRFARKNYFYPDMPKNFQTSQYDEPIAFDGWTDVEVPTADDVEVRVEIERAHMEEDTGKSLHVGGATGRIHGADYSLVDYNRAGIPLIEIVTKPIHGTARAGAAGRPRLRRPAARPAARARRLRRPDGAGLAALRREPVARAVGLRACSAPAPRPRTSTRCARSSGRSATRSAGRPRSCRRRRRGRPGDPALARGHRHHHLGPGEVRRRGLPLLPRARPGADRARRASGSRSCAPRCPSRPRERRAPAAGRSGASRDLEMRDTVGAGALDLVEETIAAGASPGGGPQVVALRAGPPRQRAGRRPRRRCRSRPADVARVQALVDEGTINDKLARQVFDGVLAGEGTPDEVVAARGLAVVSDEGALSAAVDRAIEANPDVADKIRDGKVAAAGALIGAVMKEMRGQADAGRVRELILEKLS